MFFGVATKGHAVFRAYGFGVLVILSYVAWTLQKYGRIGQILQK